MASSPGGDLWHPSRGIRFSPPPPDSKPLYPWLNHSRFLHNSKVNLNTDGNPEAIAATATATTASAKPPPSRTSSNDSQLQSALITNPTCNGSSAEAKATSQRITPPRTELDYQISPSLFETARASFAGSNQSFWSHTMYKSKAVDGSEQNVKVHYCTSRHTMEDVCKKHFMNEEVLGFDLEWLPCAKSEGGARQNVSLIQIASPGRVGLFHVALFPDKEQDLVGPAFRQIMGDSRISKAGVAIKGDCTRVTKYLGVKCQGIFELSHLYKLIKYTSEGRPELINRVPVSLAAQVKEHLHLPLYKGDSVRSSDWMQPLSVKQLTYSASDAYAGLQLYFVLEAKRKQLRPTPPRPYHAELGLLIRVAEPPAASDSEENEEDEAEEIMADELPTMRASGISAPTNYNMLAPKAPSATSSLAPTKRDHRVIAAEKKMLQYRLTNKKTIRVAPTALRAYYVWYDNNDLDAESVAKLLRDPPLQTNTVVMYVLDALAVEKMPFCRIRKDALFGLVNPKTASRDKYRWLNPKVKNNDTLSTTI